MKYSVSQLFQTFIVFIFFCNYTFSQENKSFLNNCLWIKGNCEEPKEIFNKDLHIKLINQFNFNPIINFSKDKIAQKYKNLVTKNASLFMVFKSSSKEENILFSLERGSFRTSISNQKIVCDKEVLLNKGDSKKGILLSYLYNKNSMIGRKNGNLLLEDVLFDDNKSINQLAELIYIPRCVSNKEKEIIESYLSLKYGISLNEGQNYYNSKGDKILDVKENDGFNNRITGIGKDEIIGLNQKQSKNSLEDGLIIGFDNINKSNSENEIILRDKNFLLWGDNGKNTFLEKSDDSNQKKIQRVWKVKTVSDSITKFKTQVKIDKALMTVEANFNSQDTDFMWLAIDNSNASDLNYKTAKYIRATINDEKEIVFDNVEFLSNSNYFFSIIKAKENPNNLNSNLENPLVKNAEFEIDFSSQLKLYPNPISANEKFTIQFNLKEISKVLIQISDVNGKVVKTKDLGSINNYSFNESLPVSGTYLIMMSINGQLQTSKLIVK